MLVTRKLRGSCYILVISIPLTLLECSVLKIIIRKVIFYEKERENYFITQIREYTRYILYITTKDRKNADEIGILRFLVQSAETNDSREEIGREDIDEATLE